MKKIFKISKYNKGVSEVVGTILLLGITVAIFSVLYIIVLSEPFDVSKPSSTVVAFVEGSNIIIEHRGGDEINSDSAFRFDIGSTSQEVTIGDVLDDVNSDGKWNVGERLIVNGSVIGIPISDWNNSDVNIYGIDADDQEVILSGSLDIRPSGDIGLEVSVDNTKPKVGDTINITLTASLFYGDLPTPNTEIKLLLPDELEYLGYSPKSENYNETIGIWNISNLNIGESVSITIKARVSLESFNVEPTQLCVLLDGSGSISSSDWNIALNGLSDAIDKSIPHNGAVELTVIQFAGSRASLEIGPIVVTDIESDPGYYKTISDRVRAVNHRGGYTPMSCAFLRGADTVYSSPDNPANDGDFERQVVILVTDGVPTSSCYINDSDPYKADCYYCNHKWYTEQARDYLINKLQMNSSQDEIDSIAVGVGGYYGNPDSKWLRTKIVWPNSYNWDGGESPGPGWVREVIDWQNFSSAIDETFVLLFSTIEVPIELQNSLLIDLNEQNNAVTVKIEPRD